MTNDPDAPSGELSVWGTHELGEEGEARFDIGPLALLLRRREDELWVATRRADGPEAGVPSEEVWERWAGPDASRVHIAPALADRPLVVAPEVPFHLAPGSRVRIFVRIPVRARVAFARAPDAVLFETPSIVLSETWWGDFLSGEMAYWLPISARRRIEDGLFEPHLAMCPLELRNDSDEALPVERLAVRVMHLALFRDGDRLWGSETRVRYEAGLEGSRIDADDGPPPDAPRAERIAPAREPAQRGLRALTFGRLKDAVGL